MSNHDIDATSPLPLDRRNLLKKGAAAGAIGLAAPITFDSFLSPAAACSSSSITAELLFTFSAIANGNVYTLTGTPTATGRLFVIFTFYWSDLDSSGVGGNTSGTVPTVTVTGSSGVLTQDALFQYEVVAGGNGNNAGGGNGAYLAVFSAPATGGVPQVVTVSIVDGSISGGDPALNESQNFAAHLVQLSSSDPTGVVTVVQADTAIGAPNDPMVSVTLSPPPSTAAGNVSGELVVFGSFGPIRPGNPDTPPVWPDITSAPGFAPELADTLSNEGNRDLALQTSFSQVAAVTVTNTQDTVSPVTAPFRAAAIALEINC